LTASCDFEFQKRGQLFIRARNDTLSAIAAIMVSIVRSIGGYKGPLQFQKRSQLFICVHDEAFSVVVMEKFSPARQQNTPMKKIKA